MSAALLRAVLLSVGATSLLLRSKDPGHGPQLPRLSLLKWTSSTINQISGSVSATVTDRGLPNRIDAATMEWADRDGCDNAGSRPRNALLQHPSPINTRICMQRMLGCTGSQRCSAQYCSTGCLIPTTSWRAYPAKRSAIHLRAVLLHNSVRCWCGYRLPIVAW